jgi:signal transduction histidine kinase
VGPVEPNSAVLVVDYDVARLARTRALLESDGHLVAVARDSAMAASLVDPSLGVLLLADEMQLAPTRRLIALLRERIPAIQVVLLASDRSGQLTCETLELLGVHSYVHEADGPDRLLRAVDAARRSAFALAQVQASDRLKIELLASVSHEFRSPLHIILGYLELVREGTFGPTSEGLGEALEKVSWNAANLLELVEDFLDLAKLETGAVKVEQLDVGTLVRALVQDNELLVHGRPIALRTEVPRDLPRVLADAGKLRVVVQNLLTNALKFTEHGEIVAAAESPFDGLVQVRVRDTGPGIPDDARDAIFDLYRQLQPGDMKRRGLGLGLALARRFARAMGGELGVESTVGVGSTFTLTLPAVPALHAEHGATR